MNGVIELELPKNVEVSDFEVKMIVASKLYELGKFSSGQAAEMVGLSKRAFLEVLADFKVSVFGYDADELDEDLKNL